MGLLAPRPNPNTWKSNDCTLPGPYLWSSDVGGPTKSFALPTAWPSRSQTPKPLHGRVVVLRRTLGLKNIKLRSIKIQFFLHAYRFVNIGTNVCRNMITYCPETFMSFTFDAPYECCCVCLYFNGFDVSKLKVSKHKLFQTHWTWKCLRRKTFSRQVRAFAYGGDSKSFAWFQLSYGKYDLFTECGFHEDGKY
jgi:hypothetical protein